MSEAFVETVRIENFGCVRDVRLELTRLHALIGPNDSGKSTVLAAIRTMGELLRLGQYHLERDGRLDPRGVNGAKISTHRDTTDFACLRSEHDWMYRSGGVEGQYFSMRSPFYNAVGSPMRGATLVRWDPDAIRRPAS